MNLKFSATSLEDCLEKASSELNISKESLNYKIIKEEKGFFKKKVEIEIIIEEKEAEIEPKESDINSKEIEEFGAKVEGGKIIIKENKNEDVIITLKPCQGLKLLINGERVDQITPVTSKDKIEYEFEKVEPIRNIDVTISKDKMEAYVNMKSIPEHVYELTDQGYHRNLTLAKKKVREKYPPYYTSLEIKQELQNKGIKYGIIEEEVKHLCEVHEANNALVAKGMPVKDDVSDEIRAMFNDTEQLIEHKDSEVTVDYRNKYLISNVKAGDIIGQIIPGKEGNDGIDVYGVSIKRKTAKKVAVKIGEGCKLDNKNVIATTEGKPVLKANTFTVNRLYKVDNVDLKSGNIDFVGNVEVVGTVSEGMEVRAGNELHIGKNVETAVVHASGEVVIKGNVLNSTVTAGSENVERTQYLDNVMNLKTVITELNASADQVREHNLLGERNYGEIIKILIENKFKSLPKLSRSILNYNMSQGIQHSDITLFIINKLLGLGPLKLKDSKELEEFLEILEEEIEEIQTLSVIPTDVYLSYAQGCEIESSGSVYITGKGQYTSTITALNNIEFTDERAVCRGGTLVAGSEIKLKTVGSSAGVNTILKVPRNGRITANVAYNNTIFCFGERQMMLETSGKNVEAYVDKAGDIVINKFNL